MKITEKEFDYLCDNFFPVDKEMREIIRQQMFDADVILKSELQQKVEEAETIWINFYSAKGTTFTYRDVIEKYYDVIQLLKQSHPEFKK